MIYKEKLAGEGGEIKDYTHVIGIASQYIPVDSWQYYSTSCEPSTLDKTYPIGSIFVDTSISTIGANISTVSPNNDLYIGLPESKDIAVLKQEYTSSRLTSYFYRTSYNNSVFVSFRKAFSRAEGGTLNIWLSFTPPPWA